MPVLNGNHVNQTGKKQEPAHEYAATYLHESLSQPDLKIRIMNNSLSGAGLGKLGRGRSDTLLQFE